jgi:hypothetical protein
MFLSPGLLLAQRNKPYKTYLVALLSLAFKWHLTEAEPSPSDPSNRRCVGIRLIDACLRYPKSHGCTTWTYVPR